MQTIQARHKSVSFWSSLYLCCSWKRQFMHSCTQGHSKVRCRMTSSGTTSATGRICKMPDIWDGNIKLLLSWPVLHWHRTTEPC
uniref:Uncharacterized protein n=1 Tax=Rhipicephalus appendiculatus TaxID=34631 RepID=A0A131YEV2_RHIAP